MASNDSAKRPKAILLYSGGLDSILSCEVLRRAGVEVLPLRFRSIFFAKENVPSYLAEDALLSGDISREMVELVRDNRYGFGRNMNPCMDCKQMMYRKAWEEAGRHGAHFIATGEVLGQRPKSQRMDAFRIMEAGAGLEGLVVRPLSAKKLPVTIPERSGLIERKMLLGLSGRSRKPQMELARTLGITDYPSPAGGCRLTDPNYAERIRELIRLGRLNVENARLVRHGRLYPLADGAFAVVGRNQEDNLRIAQDAPEGSAMLELRERPGPLACLVGPTDAQNVRDARKLVIRHSRFRDVPLDEVAVRE